MLDLNLEDSRKLSPSCLTTNLKYYQVKINDPNTNLKDQQVKIIDPNILNNALFAQLLYFIIKYGNKTGDNLFTVH